MYAFTTSDRFSRLAPRDRDALEALAKLDEFDAGAEILHGGRPAEWLCLVADGGVDLRARTDAGDVVIAALHPGDIFGELETFAALPESVTHVARERTIVRAVAKSPLKAELRMHRSLATGLLSVYCQSISEKLRFCNEVAARVPPPTRPPPPREQPKDAALAPGPLGRPPHLSPADAAWLSMLGQRVELGEGVVVVAEGDTTRSFYVVESGQLEVKKRVGGEERTLARLAGGDLFGFMAFVDGKPRSASVVTATQVQLTRIEPDALDKAMGLNFTVGFKFLGTLCGVVGRTFAETAQRVVAAESRR